MENIEQGKDEWKGVLRSQIISAITGTQAEQMHAYKEVGYYYMCCAPASLYKYFPDKEDRLNSVRNNQLWYSAPVTFNDVFDCDISIDERTIFNEALKFFPDKRVIRPGSKAWQDLRKTVNQKLRSLRDTFDELRNTMGVSCLSESDNSLLMWAHYANNHRGMCVEYDLLGINSALKFTAVPVIYSQERACFNFFKLESMQNDAMSLFVQSLTSKSLEWSYEKEWRIIRDQESCDNRWNTDRKGALLEMIRPSSIILGCAAEQEFEKEVRKYCENSRITLYKMEKDPVQYQLNKKVILEFDKEA